MTTSMDFWVAESEYDLSAPVKMKKLVKSRKLEFIGWGSKPLVEFLQSVGRDSSKQLSQFEVAAIINDYIKANNLLHPSKKKRILCDERLRCLFGKKIIPRIKIYDLLETHLAENNDETDDEYSSQEEGDVKIEHKRPKLLSTDVNSPAKKKNNVETAKSLFAAIIPENMKLVYLWRSVVQDLLKDPENFERKVVGAYVRIKSDPNNYFQKNSHQLLLVSGIKKLPRNGDTEEVFLQGLNTMRDVPICMLSDDNFSEEECKDLNDRANNEVQKKPTVVELQEKAQMLHADITRHWVVRELALLQILIDRANEKGWRKELFEYLERKKLLQTPAEQSRLLLEVPKVTAEELVPVTFSPDLTEDIEKGNSSSEPLLFTEDIGVCNHESEINQTLARHSSCGANVSGEEAASDTFKQQKKIENQYADFIQKPKLTNGIINESNGDDQHLNSEKSEESQGLLAKQAPDCHVIELSDDDDDEGECGVKQIVDHPESSIWYYVDPQGREQGPFSMTALKRWSDLFYFQPDFKVWRKGQTRGEGSLLKDVIRQIFQIK